MSTFTTICWTQSKVYYNMVGWVWRGRTRLASTESWPNPVQHLWDELEQRWDTVSQNLLVEHQRLTSQMFFWMNEQKFPLTHTSQSCGKPSRESGSCSAVATKGELIIKAYGFLIEFYPSSCSWNGPHSLYNICWVESMLYKTALYSERVAFVLQSQRSGVCLVL